MEEKMQGIRASDLVVGYEGKSVLKEVNFWVRPGQILTLIGPNGSGKSTLLKSITRQLKTIAGQVYLAEGTMDAYTDAALAKQMAMVTTERISPELMTCRDVVATGRYPYTGRFGVLGKEDEEKVQKALESLHALEVADRQDSRKGRRGRSWVMPAGIAIAMSILLKPEDLQPGNAPMLTLVSALAVVRAIEEQTGLRAAIKWPNDIVIDGKKVCGMLTEMSTQIDYINHIVVGIGINVHNEQFPDCLTGQPVCFLRAENTIAAPRLWRRCVNNLNLIMRFLCAHRILAI